MPLTHTWRIRKREREKMLSSEQITEIRRMCDESFKFFAQTFITHFGSFARYDPHFHDPLCDFLQHAPTPDKLIILPRNTLKTTICTILYSLWRASRDTSRRCLLNGNSEDNARNNVSTIMGIIEGNRLYGVLYPEVIPQNFKKGKWSASAANLTRAFQHPNATFEAAGTGTNVTGRRPTDIWEDDTVYPKKDQMTQMEMMPTRDDIQKAIGFHKLTLPLLDDPRTGERITVLTRWGSYDLASYIIENETSGDGGRYSVFDQPAHNPETGELNYPAFYDEETLRALKAGLGSFMYQMLYENQPLSTEFMKIRPEWIRYFYTDKDGNHRSAENYPGVKKGDVVCAAKEGRHKITTDPADSPGEKEAQQCFSVSIAATNCEMGLFIEKYLRGKWTDVQLARKTIAMAIDLHITHIVIEKDRYPHMKNTFRIEAHKYTDRLHIGECHTKGRRKDADRIMKIAALAEDGCLWLRRNMNEWENEAYTWPNGRTNDLLDATTWQILDDFKIQRKKRVVEKTEQQAYNTFSMDQILDSMNAGEERYPTPFEEPPLSTDVWEDNPAEEAPARMR